MHRRLAAGLLALLACGWMGTRAAPDAEAAPRAVIATRSARRSSSSSSVRSVPFVARRLPRSAPLDFAAWTRFRLTKRRNGGGGSGGGDAVSGAHQQLEAPLITFVDVLKDYGGSAFALTPSSDSDGAFTFASSDTNVATVSGNMVTIGNAGTTTLTAAQAASGRYAAKTVTATLTVRPIAPTIVALLSISKASTDPPFLLSDPVSNSAGAFTFTSTNTSVAILSGRTVTIMGPGTATIIATQAASGNYKSGSGSTTLTVTPGLEEA